MVPAPAVIQDEGVRHPNLVTALSAVLLVACAHAQDDARMPSAELAPVTFEPVAVVVESPPPEDAPVARPRLSRTVTLGQGTEAQYTPSAPRPQSQAGGPTQNVIVNNNIVVQGAPGYYGYGVGFGGYGGFGRTTTSLGGEGRSGAVRGAPQWGSSGWEGARRTAAPGQTPGIGGNWSPPPSYGPAPMR